MGVGREEIRGALEDYVEEANANERVGRLLRGWQSRIHIAPTDVEAGFTLVIADERIASVEDGLVGSPDLRLETTASEFVDIFWGETNPVERYNEGSLAIRGSQEHLMRLDAMAMIVFLGA